MSMFNLNCSNYLSIRVHIKICFNLQLQLIEGVNNDVVISSLMNAAHFFIQQPSHPSYPSLTTLNSIMRNIYTSGLAPVLEVPVNCK